MERKGSSRLCRLCMRVGKGMGQASFCDSQVSDPVLHVVSYVGGRCVVEGREGEKQVLTGSLGGLCKGRLLEVRCSSLDGGFRTVLVTCRLFSLLSFCFTVHSCIDHSIGYFEEK